MSAIVGIAEHYAQFVKLCRVRIEQLGITYETVDALAGFPARYTSTLMSGGKSMSVYSLFTMARVLALLPAFQHDDKQHALLKAREDWIPLKRKGPRWRSAHGKSAHRLYPDFLRLRARAGGFAYRQKISRKRRIANARKAAQIRWSKANAAG